MFEQGLWSTLSFQNPFSWNKDWSSWKKNFFFLKAEIQLKKIKFLNSFLI